MLTFGAELEIADFTRSLAKDKITEWGVLDLNDCTVVNSDGTVGDPYNGDKGGEIVTKVCNSPEQLAEYCNNIVNSLDKSAINHSCWLHIHVGLNRDVVLKDLCRMVYEWTKYLRRSEEINPPKVLSDGTVHELRNVTRLSIMTEEEYEGAMNSSTEEEFWSFFKRKRHLINIRPYRTYGTIEYRFLPATLEYDDFLKAAKMVEEITNKILNNDNNFHLDNKYIKKHTIIDLDLENKFRSNKVEYREKVDNFTGEKWNG